MAFKARKAGSTVDASAIKVMKAGAWAVATFVKAMKAGAWVNVWPEVFLGPVYSAIAGGPSISSTSARFRINSTGIIETKEGLASYVNQGTWLLIGAASDYEVMVTELSSAGDLGFTTGGSAVGVWLDPSTSREWTTTDTTSLDGSGGSWEIRVDFRKVGGSAIIATTTVTLTSERA